jgi:hypothetical protein
MRGTRKSRRMLPVGPSYTKLRPELREFLDRCIIPALVEKFLAKRKESK